MKILYARQKLVNLKDLKDSKLLGHCYYLNRDENADIYFTLNTYKNQDTKIPSRKEEMVHSVKSFYFDVDKEVDVVYPKIIELFGKPTYKITSSLDKYQLVYKFETPYCGDFSYFKKLLKGLVYHLHPIDKLFDTARIFRLTGYVNKKSNNDFLVTMEKTENYYSFERFEAIAKNYMLQDEIKEPKIKQKRGQTQPKILKVADSTNSTHFEKFKSIKKKENRKYSELLEKYKHDKSTADIAYIKWLRTSKLIEDEEVLILKLFEARGYKELMDKHGYQMDYYINNILEKTR